MITVGETLFRILVFLTIGIFAFSMFFKFWWAFLIIGLVVYLVVRVKHNRQVDEAADAYWANRTDTINGMHLADRETRNQYYREFVLPRVTYHYPDQHKRYKA